jgi:methionyl-tRNA formyltransferase
MKILFMGTPRFALVVLQRLLRSEHEIVAVYTKAFSPVALLARSRGLTVETPHTLKGYDKLEQADVAVVAAYGLILPASVLNAFRFGCINVHPSLLPRWRGAAPLERSIMAGDIVTAVAIMQMDAGLDTGPILAQESATILPSDTGGTLADRLAEQGSQLLINVLRDMQEGRSIEPLRQSDEGITYAHKITKQDELIDWTQDGEAIGRQIRALNPSPCAYTMINGERIKIIEANFEVADHATEPGTVINNQMHIAAHGGIIVPKVVQRAGGKQLGIMEFLRGFRLPPPAKT